MEIVEIKCSNCDKDIYVQKDYVREKIFCTIGCMQIFDKKVEK